MSTFVRDKQLGKIGEAKASRLLKQEFLMDPVDVSEIPEYQDKDIDILAGGRAIEVKTDFKSTGNMFYETVGNHDRGTHGNMITTEADILFYVFERYDMILTVDMQDYRKWVNRHKVCFREVGARYSKSRGLLIPVTQFLNSSMNIGIFVNYESVLADEAIKYMRGGEKI